MKRKKYVSLIDCPTCSNPRGDLEVISTVDSAMITCHQCDLTMRMNRIKCVENEHCKKMIEEAP